MLNSNLLPIQSDSELLLRVGYEASELDMCYKCYKCMLLGWNISPVIKGKQIIGVFFEHNGEIHFSIQERFRKRWLTRKIVNNYLKPVLIKHGEITTAVPDDKPQGHSVVKKFGFEKDYYLDGFTFYKLGELKWV